MAQGSAGNSMGASRPRHHERTKQSGQVATGARRCPRGPRGAQERTKRDQDRPKTFQYDT
eukprot:8004053-Pyramimonas_sp.AAC.1